MQKKSFENVNSGSKQEISCDMRNVVFFSIFFSNEGIEDSEKQRKTYTTCLYVQDGNRCTQVRISRLSFPRIIYVCHRLLARSDHGIYYEIFFFKKKNRKNNASCFSDHNSLKVGNDNSIKDGEIKSTCLEIVRCLLNTHRSQRKTN